MAGKNGWGDVYRTCAGMDALGDVSGIFQGISIPSLVSIGRIFLGPLYDYLLQTNDISLLLWGTAAQILHV